MTLAGIYIICAFAVLTPDTEPVLALFVLLSTEVDWKKLESELLDIKLPFCCWTALFFLPLLVESYFLGNFQLCALEPASVTVIAAMGEAPEVGEISFDMFDIEYDGDIILTG